MPDTRAGPGVVWFRRDLRLDDNPAWAAATRAHDDVVAVFVLEPALLQSSGPFRRDQLVAHLQALHEQLVERGGGLVVRPGPAVSAIPSVLADSEASALYLNHDVTPFSVDRDLAVMRDVNLPVHAFHGLTVHEPGAVLTKAGALSKVFTPFHRAWAATPLSEWPQRGSGRPAVVGGVPIPHPTGPVRQPPGEIEAWKRVMAWLDRVDDYSETRDLPAIDGTSDLSADLKFGTLAARTLIDVVGTETPGRAAFVRQLAWRDWWAHTLAVRPDLATTAIKPAYDEIAWRDDPGGFERWCTGQTGYPIVDAGMRQLTQTGWMHNRVRMICASFLVKDLLIDWRKGERFFRHHLVDADLAQNAGNWQWVAGTGPDAAPYFRIFNPTSQGRRFDPDGAYVRRWVPELAGLGASVIHEPASAAATDLAAAGIELGRAYPTPLVEHGAARARTLAAYQRALR